MDIKPIVFGLLWCAAEPIALAHEHDHDDHDTHHSDEQHAHDDHEDHHAEDDHNQAAGSAHVHGSWSLFAALDEDALSITLTGPLYDVLGFEATPSTPEQQDEVDRLLRELSESNTLVEPNASANCSLSSPVDVSLPDGFAASGKTGTDTHHDHGADDHDHDAADIDIDLIYTCESPDRISELNLSVFSMYPSIETIDAVFLSDSGQSASRLTAGTSVFNTN